MVWHDVLDGVVWCSAWHGVVGGMVCRGGVMWCGVVWCGVM